MDYGTYVSCIKIGKQPIIPPLLSEECKNEMRYYRDLAMSLEKRRKCRRNSADSGVMISSNDGSCLRKANVSVANEPLPTADTSKGMVSADGSSSNEMMVSAEGSSGDSDHDNVFFEAEKTSSPLSKRRNSYTIERNAHNETPDQAVASQNSTKSDLTTASERSSTPVVLERRNSLIRSPNSASKGSKIPVPCERRSSFTRTSSPGVLQNPDSPIPREHQNAFTKTGSPGILPNPDSPIPREHRNSFTKTGSPGILQIAAAPVTQDRQNSFTRTGSPSALSNENALPRERRNSFTVQDHRISASESCAAPVPRERRNSYTVDPAPAAMLTPPVPKERRNSYTLESPSPVMLQFIQSLGCQDPNKQCELFVESLQCGVADAPGDECQLGTGITETELSLEDLVSDSTESDDLQLSELGMWDACSDETLHNFLKADLQPDSLPSSVCASPVSVVPACDLSESLKSSCQPFDGPPAPPVMSLSSVCNGLSDLEPLADVISLRKDRLEERVDDSFTRDFRYLDLSNISYDSDFLEGGHSECSSVSLSKFLSGDRPAEGAEAEYVAFSYMREQLEQKHRDQFKRLLREQQREHDRLKAQFTKVSSASPRHTPSPKSSYAYSGSVLLKKYTPTSGHSTPLSSKGERRANESCGRSSGAEGLSVVEAKQKTATRNGRPPQPALTVEQAASRINAAVRGYLTRRLLKTERVTHLVQTIKDCLATAVSLQNEPNLEPSELNLKGRLLQQLTVACSDLHSTVSLPVPEQMAVIADDREKKFRLSLKRRTPLPLSEATRRTLERKTLANSAPPAQRKYDRKRCKSASSTASETNSCRSTPGSRRHLASTILSQKFSASVEGRRPWR